MTVDVLAIDTSENKDVAPDLYAVRISVDGVEYTLHLAREGGCDGLETLNYTDAYYWDLFAEDHFYFAAIPRLLRDFLRGEQISFPLRLVEVGSGARYRKDVQRALAGTITEGEERR